MGYEVAKHYRKFTAKFGIGWFGNHTKSLSTTLKRIRRSREFSFGYFSFGGQKKVTLSAAIPEKVNRKYFIPQIPHHVIAVSRTARSLCDEFASSFLSQ